MSSIHDLAEEDGWVFLGTLGSLILKKQLDFDPRNFGHKKLLDLIKTIPGVIVEERLSGKNNAHFYVKAQVKIPSTHPDMPAEDRTRLSRLTAILVLLQSRKLVTAAVLAHKFDISIRTVYRDIKALENAGIPVLTEEGKGYTLMEGYTLPPLMFTETEANALVTVEQLVLKNKDASLVRDYREALTRVKAVLRHSMKTRSELLAQRIVSRQNPEETKTSNYLSALQLALTHYRGQ